MRPPTGTRTQVLATPSCSGTRRPAAPPSPHASPPSTTRCTSHACTRWHQLAVHDAANAIDRRSPATPPTSGCTVPGLGDAAVPSAPARPCGSPRRPSRHVRPGCRPASPSVATAYAAAARRRPGPVPEGRRRRARGSGPRVPSSPAARMTASDTPLLVPDFPQGTLPGQPGGSLPIGPSPQGPAGATSGPSRCARRGPSRSARPSAPQRAYAPTWPRSRAWAATASPPRAPDRRADPGRAVLDGVHAAGSGTGSPVDPVARTPTPWEPPRLFGLLNIAMADGYIGSFDASTARPSGGP